MKRPEKEKTYLLGLFCSSLLSLGKFIADLKMKSEQKHLEELKARLEKEHGRAITDEEAAQAYQLVQLLAKITVDNAYREAAWLKRLEVSPKGFHLDGNFTCIICGHPAKNENSCMIKTELNACPARQH